MAGAGPRAGRRAALGGGLGGGLWAAAALATPGPARARGLGAYVKRRPPGSPAEYLPPVLEARRELAEGVGAALERAGALEAGPPGEPGAEAGDGAGGDGGGALTVRQATQDVRNLLRVGTLGSLRDNMRSVTDASGGAGKEEAARFFTNLEAFDSRLTGVIRGRETLDVAAADADLDSAVAAIDLYVAALPEEAVTEARGVMAALEAPASPAPPDSDVGEGVRSDAEGA